MNNLQTQTISPAYCPDRQLLILDAVRPESLSKAVRETLFEHLCLCERCAALYDEVCGADRELADVSPDLISDAALKAAGFMTQEESLEDIWRRIEAKEAQPQHNHRRHLAYRIGKVALALAACLLLAVSVFWRQGRTNPKSAIPSVALSAKHLMPGKDMVGTMENPSDDNAVFFPEPAHFDPAKVDYAQWCQEHEKWFAATFPWIFEVQKVLRARGIQADYAELLMVSGDLWQFRFDSKGPLDQPLAVCDRSTVDRLAKHYQVPAESLRRSITSAVPAGRSTDSGSALAAKSMERWRVALASAGRGDAAGQTDLLLSSLRASRYLQETQAVACLWMVRNPQRAQEALASCGTPAGSLPMSALVQSLSRQCTAAQQIIDETLGLLSASASNRCGETDGRWALMEACLRKIEKDGR